MPGSSMDVLQNIYDRIDEKRKSKDPRYVRSFRPILTDKETTDYACRMYESYMENHRRRMNALRQKYHPPSAYSSTIDQETVHRMADRLCPKPHYPSILQQVLMNTAPKKGGSQISSPSTKAERSPAGKMAEEAEGSSPDNSYAYEEDFASDSVASPTHPNDDGNESPDEQEPVVLQRQLLLTTLETEPTFKSVKTFLARHQGSVLRELGRPHRMMPPPGDLEQSKLPGYNGHSDPHLFWYWKNRVKHQKEFRRRAKQDQEKWLREYKKKEASFERLQHLRPYYRPLFVLPHLQKEKIAIEEARRRVFIQMKESDAWKDILKQHQEEIPSASGGQPTGSDSNPEYSDDYTDDYEGDV